MSLAKEILAEARELETQLRALAKKAILASEEEDRTVDIAEAVNALDGVLRAAKDAYAQYEAVGIAQLPHEITIPGQVDDCRVVAHPGGTHNPLYLCEIFWRGYPIPIGKGCPFDQWQGQEGDIRTCSIIHAVNQPLIQAGGHR